MSFASKAYSLSFSLNPMLSQKFTASIFISIQPKSSMKMIDRYGFVAFKLKAKRNHASWDLI